MQLKNIPLKMMDIAKQNYKDFKQFNTVERAYFSAQLLWLVAIVILMTLTPLLVKAIVGETALTGLIRATYMWSVTATLFFAGDIIKRFSIQKTLLTTSIVRSILFMVLTFLIFAEQVTFQFVVIFFALNAIITAHSHLLDMDTGGANRIFSNADRKAKALYLFRFFDYLCLLIIPIMFGVAIDFLDKHMGTYTALGIAFVFFSAAMLLSANIYYQHLRLPSEEIKGFRQRKKPWVYDTIFKTPQRLWRTATIVWSSQTLKLRFGMVCLETFIDDALLMIILPTFALDILHAGASGNGLLISAMNAGGLLATLMLLSNAEQLQKKYGFYKYIFWLGLLSCVAFMPTILLWMYPSLIVAIVAVVFTKFLYEPLRCRMDSLLQIEINNNEQAKPEESNIFSLLALASTFSAGLGSVIFAFIFLHSTPGTTLYFILGDFAPMKIVSALFFVFCVINVLGIVWFKHHVYHTYKLHYMTEKEELIELSKDIDKLHMVKYMEEVFHGSISADRPTIALLAPPTLDNIAIVRSGGKLFPGDIHLVLDPSWIVQELQYDGTHRLYLKKGLYFDRESDPILAEYKVPRVIHYYDNFYTAADLGNEEAILLEKQLDTPMGCDSRLEHFINENLLTRIWLASHAVDSPDTLAFLMPKHPLVEHISQVVSHKRFTMVEVYPIDQENKHALLTDKIKSFIASYHGKEIVVKPSGAGFSPPKYVEFFSVSEIEKVVNYIIALENNPLMTAQGAILVEGKIHSPQLFLKLGENDGSGHYCIHQEQRIPLHILTPDEISLSHEDNKKEWVIHVLAARAPWNRCVVSGIIARVGAYGKPLLPTAAVVPFETIISALRIQYGVLTTDKEVFLLERRIDELATTALRVIETEINQYPHKADDALQAQIDYFGLDLMFEIENGQLNFKIIATRDHNVGKEYQFDIVYPDRMGEHSKAWIATMLARARQSACRGKRLVMIGAGYEMKKFFFDRAKELGIHLILVDSKDTWAKEIVEELIVVDNSDPKLALQQALTGLHRSIESFGPIDGITTFWDFSVVATAELARELKLPFLDVANARTTKSKLKTRQTLSTAGLSAPRFFYIEDENTLEIVLRQIETIAQTTNSSLFPMIIKPTTGAGSMNTLKVNNAKEARDFYLSVHKITDASGTLATFHHAGRFIIEEFISGKEFDVDMALQQGKVKYVSISDNWSEDPSQLINPQRDSLPCARLTMQEQKACIHLAVLSLQVLGITDGIMHIEGKYDAEKQGAEILEINTRPAGEYLTPWQKEVWGVDIPELMFAIALQIPIYVYKSPMPLVYLESYCFNADKNGVFQSWQGVDELQQYPGFKEFISFAQEGDKVSIAHGRIDQLGFVTVEGSSKEEALQNLAAILSKIKFVIN